jgi:hypothetical protein
MPDDAALRAFAGFMQALLPRLLLYPGGLFALLLCLPVLRLRRTHGGLLREGTAVPALALAWAGLALLPLPGLAPLPGGPDLLVPLGLLLAATLLLFPAPPDHAGIATLGLLLAAPLATLAFAPAGGLFVAVPAAASPGALAARVLLLLAFALGLVAAQSQPPPGDALGCLAAVPAHLGWAGLALVLSPWPLAAAPAWAVSVLLVGVSLGFHLLCAWPPLPTRRRLLITAGWIALLLGLVGAFIPL